MPIGVVAPVARADAEREAIGIRRSAPALMPSVPKRNEERVSVASRLPKMALPATHQLVSPANLGPLPPPSEGAATLRSSVPVVARFMSVFTSEIGTGGASLRVGESANASWTGSGARARAGGGATPAAGG